VESQWLTAWAMTWPGFKPGLPEWKASD
jgi:hypothetical protein